MKIENRKIKEFEKIIFGDVFQLTDKDDNRFFMKIDNDILIIDDNMKTRVPINTTTIFNCVDLSSGTLQYIGDMVKVIIVDCELVIK